MSSICHPSVFVLSPATIPPAYERFVAYAIVGILFGLAYRGRAFMALVIVIGAAIALEGLQHLTPDRHGRLDLLEKASGG
jgi:hypothetical protein